MGGFFTDLTKLEPKWQSHFGNFIDNTSLALHKFQAKSEVFPKRIENVNGQNSMQKKQSILFFYAVAWCRSGFDVSLFTAQADRPNLWWCHLHNFHPNRRTGGTTQPHRRMTPVQGAVQRSAGSVPVATVLARAGSLMRFKTGFQESQSKGKISGTPQIGPSWRKKPGQ